MHPEHIFARNPDVLREQDAGMIRWLRMVQSINRGLFPFMQFMVEFDRRTDMPSSRRRISSSGFCVSEG
jgi:hypothetical protein